MSSPPLPSPASLQPVSRPQGFVTARTVFAKLELHTNEQIVRPDSVVLDTDHEHVATVSEVEKRRKKAPNTDKPAAKPRPRKKTVDSTGVADSAQITKPKTRKKASDKVVQDGAEETQPAPKRSRAKRPTAADTADASKSAAKRGRKKKAQTDKGTDTTEAPAPVAGSAEDPSESPPDHVNSYGSVSAQSAISGEADGTADHAFQKSHVPIESSNLDPAPARRRNWTPPVEPDLPPSFQRSSHASPALDTTQGPVAFDGEANGERPSRNIDEDDPTSLHFTNLMGNFSYQPEHVPPPPLSRANSNQPTTKRKRIDAVDIHGAEEPIKRKKDAVPKPKLPKKPKAPKKKPITITALATAAYRAQLPEDASDQTKVISDFFVHPQEDFGPAPQEDQLVATLTKTSRPKTADAKPASRRKRAKKVQITVPPPVIKLDTPEAALENLKSQQWLFGSSSQLAAAESPSELRDLQQALKESEEMVPSQQAESLHATSYTRVPSAPHGTSLSVGQAYRVLWMSAARDFEDSTFASDESQDTCVQASTDHLPTVLGDASDISDHLPSVRDEQGGEAMSEVIAIPSSTTSPTDDESTDSGYVDIDEIGRVPDVAVPRVEAPRAGSESLLNTPSETLRTASEVIPLDTPSETANLFRPVLGVRDPNTSLSNHSAKVDGKRPTATYVRPVERAVVVSVQSLDKRPRGRPRKTIEEHDTVSPSKPKVKSCEPASVSMLASPNRSRDRPRKVSASPAPVSSPKPNGPQVKFGSPKPISPVRPRGRPRKTPSLGAPPASSQTLKLPPLKTVSPRSRKKITVVDNSSDYLDIDDIDDPELAQNPPSPPRRSLDSPSKVALDLDRPLAATVTSTAPRTAKQIQAEFATIALTLFPRITRAVRSTPPSKNPKAPTWHEKMLLYDPIVLEDLTAWLNAQGLGIETCRPKAAEKAKKGKKKADEEIQGIGMELVMEELQPWMVQKWCEEHSVCCLWKEGLRGGVRQRY